MSQFSQTNQQKIHPTAIIDPDAELHPSVEVGPYSIIGPKCRLAEGVKIASHVVLESHTILGQGCEVSSGTVLGGKPQDTKFQDETSFVVIADGTVVREYVTIHRSSKENGETTVGARCMIMAYCHIAHDCHIGNEVMMANMTQLAGYVTVEDNVFLGGTNSIHQGVTIGRMSIMGGVSATRQDIPPFSITDGRPAIVVGVNKVALKRHGYSLEAREKLKEAFKYLWFSDLSYSQAIEKIKTTMSLDQNLETLIHFLENSKRGVHHPRTSRVRDKALSADAIMPF